MKINFYLVLIVVFSLSILIYTQNHSISILAQESNTSMKIVNGFNIPTTISKESQDKLEIMFATDERQNRSATSTPTDFDGWKKLQVETENSVVPQVKKLVDNFGADIESKQMGSVNVIDIKPKDYTDNGKVIVYTHGGGYILYSANSTLLGPVIVANTTGVRVISIDYTLAPFSKWDKTTDEIISVIDELIKKHGYDLNDIAMYGDSAGGAITLALY